MSEMEDTSDSEQPTAIAGIVLCGGRSGRMGRSKADLVFGSETLLERVVRILQKVAGHVVVVAAANQPLPDLGANVTEVEDSEEFGGPLFGMEAGLRAVEELSQDFSIAYLTSWTSRSFVRNLSKSCCAESKNMTWRYPKTRNSYTRWRPPIAFHFGLRLAS